MVDKRRGEDKVNDPASGFAARGGEEARGLLVDDLLGRNDWRGSKLGFISGASMLASAARRAGENLLGSFSRVGKLYGAATRGEDTSALPVIEESDTAARFEAAMEAYGKTEDDLKNMASNSFRGFYFYALMIAVMASIGGASFAFGNVTGLPFVIDAVLRFAAVPALLALMLRFGHLNWMVRNRRLDGLGRYILSGALFPTRSLGRVAAALLSIAVIGALVATPGQALASSVTDVFATPNKDDVFFNMLGYVVPGIGPVTGYETSAHKAVAQGFLAFSAVLMFIGSLMLGWHVLNGTVQSAYTGKVLGERWHQIWAPGRVALGLGSLAPVAGGFGAAQVLVVYLIVWGGNLANTVWTPYVEALASGITSQQQANSNTNQYTEKLSQRLAGAEDVIYQIARREVCNATINRYNDVVYKGSSSSGWLGVGGNKDTAMVTQNPSLMEKGSWTDTAWNVVGWFNESPNDLQITHTRHQIDYGSMCGTAEITLDKVTSGGANTAMASHYRAAEKFDEARARAIRDAITTIRDPAKKIAETYVPNGEKANALDQSKADTRDLRNNFRQALETAATSYRNTMVEAARQQLAALDVTQGGKSLVKTMATEATAKGWANAGAYYVTLAQVQSAVNAKAMAKPIFGDMNLTPGAQVSRDMLKSVVGDQNDPGAILAFDNWWKDVVRTEFTPIDTDSAKAGRLDKNSDSSFSAMMDALGTDGMLVGALSLFKDMDPFNPMKSMIDFGHKILMYFYLIMAVVAGASLFMSANLGLKAAATAISSVVSAGGLGTIILGFFSMLMFALFAVGVVHAYVIPMVPYIQVLFFLVGMMVLLVEALIAAPLWAFFHVRMDGGELVDQMQRPGYMIAFNLLLRPALMILGLMMSLFVFGSLAWFISHTFTVAAVAAGGEHSVGPIGTIVMVCILTYLHYQIALRSFGLINQVPDRVTRWFGHGSENLGEENENRQAVGFAVGNISNRTEGILRAGGAGGAMSAAMKQPGRNQAAPGRGPGKVTAGDAAKNARAARNWFGR